MSNTIYDGAQMNLYVRLERISLTIFLNTKKRQPKIEMPTNTRSGRQVKNTARLIDEMYKMSIGKS